MSMLSINTGSKRKLARGFIFLGLAVSLSGCALGPIGGAAISLASGTLTGAADITSSVVGGAVDTVSPDGSPETVN